ncbi:MAG: hypothetical protein K5857_09770 [Lachnospiraceae bacterium]|nr:hypothetical protein [Lachnospiraceae bacterium]
MKKRTLRIIAGIILALSIFVAVSPVQASAKVYLLPDGTMFDSDYYAAIYPEMQAAYANGKYPERLLWHYLTYGIKEGRLPSLYSTYNPSPAVMSTPYVYQGNYSVVPYTTLYPYTPYVYPYNAAQAPAYPYTSNSYQNIPNTPSPYAYMCIPYVY